LSKEFKTLNAKAKSPSQQADMQRLLNKFVSEKAAFHGETIARSTTKYLDSKTKKKTVYATYDDVCIRYSYDLFDEANNAKFDHIVKAGYVTRTKLPHKEVKKLQDTPFPSAAHFKYQWTGFLPLKQLASRFMVACLSCRKSKEGPASPKQSQHSKLQIQTRFSLTPLLEFKVLKHNGKYQSIRFGFRSHASFVVCVPAL
jgi:hypothetical protein